MSVVFLKVLKIMQVDFGTEMLEGFRYCNNRVQHLRF